MEKIAELKRRENDEFERNKKNEESMINNKFLPILSAINKIEGFTRNNQLQRIGAAEIISMRQHDNPRKSEDRKWVETPFAKYLTWSICHILKKHAYEEGMSQIDFSEILQNIEALKRREFDEYLRHKNGKKLLRRDSKAIKRDIHNLANPDLEHNLENLVLENEPVIENEPILPNVDIENDEIELDLVD